VGIFTELTRSNPFFDRIETPGTHESDEFEDLLGGIDQRSLGHRKRRASSARDNPRG
jgi:hypothetical protein